LITTLNVFYQEESAIQDGSQRSILSSHYKTLFKTNKICFLETTKNINDNQVSETDWASVLKMAALQGTMHVQF
jgi:hypothetical protein